LTGASTDLGVAATTVAEVEDESLGILIQVGFLVILYYNTIYLSSLTH
jgi:hypothetical protein